MHRRQLLLALCSGIAGLLVPYGCRFLAAGAKDASDGNGPALPGRSITIAAAGDVVLGFNLQAHFDEQLAAGSTHERLWPLYFSGVKSVLASADLALVNLECPFTERGAKLAKNFNFSARPELIEILKDGAVNAVTLANNHVMDYGAEGLDDTLDTLDGANIAHFGAGKNLDEARAPAVVERAGMKIGLLGYYFQSAREMIEPQAVYATKRRPGVAGCFVDMDCIRRQVTEDVRRLVPRVDAAIAYFHWGKEGSTEVQSYQIELAHLCVDLGCKIVFGAHPHRLQGVETYKDAPIFYSLGNFVYGGKKDPGDTLSAIAVVRVPRGGAVSAELVPIQVTRWPEAPFQPFVLPTPAREEALARIATLSAGFPATIPMLKTYLNTPASEAR